MIKKLPISIKNLALLHQNTYKLLSHKHIEMEKQKFFQEQEETYILKAKFFLKEMKYTLIQGCKELKEDTKWLINISKTKNSHDLTGFEIAKKKRIIADLLKFIPYSIILLIPVAEVFLPVIIWLFPNAIPSFFLFDTHHDEKIEQLQKIQQQSHQILLQKLLNVFKSEDLRSDCIQQYDEFKKQFYQVMDHLNAKLDYRNFSSDDLIKVKQFLGGNFYTGTATINKIVNLFTGTIPRVSYKIYRYLYYRSLNQIPPTYQDPFFVKENFRILKFNYQPFEYFKRKFLIWQIDRKYRMLEEQDLAFYKYGMDDIQGTDIKDFARERGLATLSCYLTLKNVIYNDWVKQIKEKRLVDNNIKLWYSVMLYNFMARTNHEQN